MLPQTPIDVNSFETHPPLPSLTWTACLAGFWPGWLLLEGRRGWPAAEAPAGTGNTAAGGAAAACSETD